MSKKKAIALVVAGYSVLIVSIVVVSHMLNRRTYNDVTTDQKSIIEQGCRDAITKIAISASARELTLTPGASHVHVLVECVKGDDSCLTLTVPDGMEALLTENRKAVMFARDKKTCLALYRTKFRNVDYSWFLLVVAYDKDGWFCLDGSADGYSQEMIQKELNAI